MRVWDVMARNPNALLVLMSGPKNLVLSVAISPDNRFLVAGTGDKALRVWNRDFVVRQGLSTLSGHASRVRGSAYSPDRRHFASADDEGRTRIWDVQTGETVRELAPVGGTVWNLTYSPSGKYLVTCTADNNAYVWDQTSSAPVAILDRHTADVEDAEFSGDGRYLVTGADDHKGILWNTETWEAEVELTIPGVRYPGYIWNVAYSPDGRWIATGYTGGHVTLWRVDLPATGAVQVTPVVTFTEHTGHVDGFGLQPGQPLPRLRCVGRTTRIWSTETLTRALETPHHPNDVFVYSVSVRPGGFYRSLRVFGNGCADGGHVRSGILAQNSTETPPELVAELGAHPTWCEPHVQPRWSIVASGSWDRTIRRYLVPSRRCGPCRNSTPRVCWRQIPMLWRDNRE